MKKAYSLTRIALILIVGFFITLWMLSLWAQYTQEYGPSAVMFGGTLYIQDEGSVGSRIQPDSFTLAGKVKRMRHSHTECKRDFDAYKLRRRTEIYANAENTDIIYILDPITERYVPHNARILP